MSWLTRACCAQIALAYILLAENHPVEHLLVACRWAFANGALPPCVAEFKLFEQFAESLWSDRGSASNFSATIKLDTTSKVIWFAVSYCLTSHWFLDATNSSLIPGGWHDNCLQSCTWPSCHVRATWAARHTAAGGGSSAKTRITCTVWRCMLYASTTRMCMDVLASCQGGI